MHTKTWKNALIAAMECGRFIEWLEIPWAGPPGLEDCKLYQDTCLEIRDKATAELFQQIYIRQGHKLLKTHNLVNVDLCSFAGHCNILSYLTTIALRLCLTVRKRFSLEITPGGGDGGDRPRWWETVYNFSSRSQPRRWHLQPRWWQFFLKMMTWWHVIIPNYDMCL